ncbi:MAG TPA: transcription termination factor Rho [Gemmatimonadaceae bacterium]|nr:transcription termination factor Rho [Gemmatimonadaceae bacterium]
MTDSPRTPRRGRGRPRRGAAPDVAADADPYLESPASTPDAAPAPDAPADDKPRRPTRSRRGPRAERTESPERSESAGSADAAEPTAGREPQEPREPREANDAQAAAGSSERSEGDGNGREASGNRPWQDRGDRGDRGDRNERGGRGRRGRRQRGRGRRGDRNDRGERGDRNNGEQRPNGNHGDREYNNAPPVILVVDGEATGWFDQSREAGFIRRAEYSYLADPGDAWVPPQLVRQFGIRRGDLIVAKTGRDSRGRIAVAEIVTINGEAPVEGQRRTDFQTLIASYPERRITLETGRSAKGGPELTRRAIDLIAPIGYGQRALIVAPARAGKTMLMQAITEGIAINHPDAHLIILLVDERPEEVSEAISWGVGEVVASSFDQPAKRHVEVVEMVQERARRLVEQGKDVIIVLDSLTRMARAFNTAERGTGRTLSGGLDTSAMAKPKAFFGSARNILPQHGGGSLTIIATALVETGSRMDDVIFEEFKGTGNCEIKLDRGLAEKRIFPAFDVASSGTRREEKLYKAEQIDAIYTLRRGLQQMPPQSGMEWLIKRIASTTSNDALLAGL